MVLDLVDSGHLDGAFLDINLAGEYYFAVAELLHERGVPFVFLTGYDDNIASIAARLFSH